MIFSEYYLHVVGVHDCSHLENIFFLSVFFFFKQKTAYEMRISDWSSDVCSSDLNDAGLEPYLNSIHPIGRFSEPHEQAQAAVWLLSDAASFVTGSCLAADGGFTAI